MSWLPVKPRWQALLWLHIQHPSAPTQPAAGTPALWHSDRLCCLVQCSCRQKSVQLATLKMVCNIYTLTLFFVQAIYSSNLLCHNSFVH